MNTSAQRLSDPASNQTPSRTVGNKGKGHPPATTEPPSDPRLLGPTYRAATVGIVGLVSLIAFEAMGNAAVMPVAATALNGLAHYGVLFGGPLATAIVGMVVAGRLSDRHSPIHVVWAGGGCFVAGLLVAAAADSIAWLLIGRLATGLGSGTLAVALYALVGRVYPAALHSTVFAAFSAAWVLPALLAPAGSGLVTQLFGWRWSILGTALLSLPIALLLMTVPVTRPHASRVSARPTAMPALLWALAAASSALTLHMQGQSSAGPAQTPHSGISLAVTVAALAMLFVAGRQLLPPRTLRAHHGMPAAIALSGLSQGAFFAAEAFLPLMLHRERHVSVAAAGLLLSIGAVSWSLGAAYRARMHGRISNTRLLRTGFALLASGIALSMSVLAPAAPVQLSIIGWATAGAGMGLVSPTLSVLTLALAPAGEQGQTGAALRLSAALTTTSALAVSGSAFALLFVTWPTAAFAAGLGLAGSLAIVGVMIAHRAEGDGR